MLVEQLVVRLELVLELVLVLEPGLVLAGAGQLAPVLALVLLAVMPLDADCVVVAVVCCCCCCC